MSKINNNIKNSGAARNKTRRASDKRISKIERLVRQYLRHLLPDSAPTYNYRPNWLKNPKTGHNLELDIYYPELGIAIEVNGISHILKYQMYKDSIKVSGCKDRGINLIIVKHKGDILKLKKKLGLSGNIPPGLHKQIINYKPNKKSFNQLDKKVRKKKKYEDAINKQNKEIEFNLNKMRAQGLI